MLQIYELKYIPFLMSWIILGAIIFFILFKIPVPYGKFSNTSWRPRIPSQLGWFVMEIISPIAFAYFFLIGDTEKSLVTWMFFLCWVGHYFNRSFIYPFRQQSPARIPLFFVFLAILFNTVNGSINGYYLGSMETYTLGYSSNWNFILGVLLFSVGMVINIKSDNILLKLKSQGNGYQIPNGFLYKYVSCPNYFGEILEWTAFALMTWSWAGLSFMIWTIANLIPRAVKGHRWYHQTFDDYPKKRKIIFPFFF